MPKSRLAAAVARMDALSNWERRPRRRMRPTLEPVLDLLGRIGSPERAFRAVHVAGSKGKGSLTALVAAGLERGGLATGTYLSPHVERINERVRIGGADVQDGPLAEALEEVLAARGAATEAGDPGKDATWFDTLTAAAFLIFQRAGVEWAAVECGLGGRLDSTNVIVPEVCAITTIELEHTSVLGGTRELIAAEKAGILKPQRCAGHAARGGRRGRGGDRGARARARRPRAAARGRGRVLRGALLWRAHAGPGGARARRARPARAPDARGQAPGPRAARRRGPRRRAPAGPPGTFFRRRDPRGARRRAHARERRRLPAASSWPTRACREGRR